MSLTMDQNNCQQADLTTTTGKEESLNQQSSNSCSLVPPTELVFESGVSGKSSTNAIDIGNENIATCETKAKENIDNESLQDKFVDVNMCDENDIAGNFNKSDIPNAITKDCVKHTNILKSSLTNDDVNTVAEIDTTVTLVEVEPVIHDVSATHECNEIVDSLGKLENNGKGTVDVGLDNKLEAIPEIQEFSERSSIYCSTPVASKMRSDEHSVDLSQSNEFAQLSPLSVCPNFPTKMNIKRKNINLDSIQEIDEDAPYMVVEKKRKLQADSEENTTSNIKSNENIPSTMSCFEPPAKSVLKKWQPSCLSRTSSSTSYIVLDECDASETSKHGEDLRDSAMADDFELAYKSLTEELLKSSSNLEILEKYHSQVQLECQLDDEKFDEVLQELTLNIEWDDVASTSLKTMEESVLSTGGNTIVYNSKEDSITIGAENVADETLKNNSSSVMGNTVIEIKCVTENADASANENNSIDSKIVNKTENISNVNVLVKIKGDDIPETSKANENEMLKSGQEDSVETPHQKNLSILYADKKDLTLDEEDFLLEEDINAKKKPYEFFEFISSDPKENEDNYNPEWQKLGQLTTDEERYKAVRDRWRSLVPPNPNRDLSYRQWRARNRKPPLSFASLNNNHEMDVEYEKNQLCTAVYDMKIKRMNQDLENGRMKIAREMNMDFEKLAVVQDQANRLLILRGGNQRDVALLHSRGIEECRSLKNRLDQEMRVITKNVDNKIASLRAAKEEVLEFQQFYKGVGVSGDSVCLYLTDLQVQELMETEDMVEKYTQFYK